MFVTKNAKLYTITFFIILTCILPITVSSSTSNHDIQNKMTSIQSNQITWNLTMSYSIKNESNSQNFVIGTTLMFFQNITLYNYVSPSIVYWIYNSSNNLVYTMTPPQICYNNKSFIANQSISSGISSPLTSDMVSTSDNYTISVFMNTINKTYTNSFSAIVTNSSIRITFKNLKTTDSGMYDITNNLTKADITNSSSLPVNFTWFLLAVFPMLIFSKRRRNTRK